MSEESNDKKPRIDKQGFYNDAYRPNKDPNLLGANDEERAEDDTEVKFDVQRWMPIIMSSLFIIVYMVVVGWYAYNVGVQDAAGYCCHTYQDGSSLNDEEVTYRPYVNFSCRDKPVYSTDESAPEWTSSADWGALGGLTK